MRKNIIVKCIIIELIVVLSVALVAMLICDDVLQKRQLEHLRQLQITAKPYEKEISEIQQKLDDMKKELDVVEETSQIGLLFMAKSTTDIDWIEEKVSPYGYPVTVVLDVGGKESANIVNRISTSTLNMNFILSSIDQYEYSEDTLHKIRSVAKKLGVTEVNMWFLNEGEYQNDNIELLSQEGYSGFTQLTEYESSIKTGTSKQGLFYVEHAPVESMDHDIAERIKLGTQESKPLLLSFDIGVISSGNQYQQLVDMVFNSLNVYTKSKSTKVVNVKEILDYIKVHEQEISKKQEAYLKYEGEMKERIKELEDKINQIYTNWDIIKDSVL